MNDFAVVAVGYNRPDCMLRLLNSLNQADYCGDSVPLIISIDNSGNDSVLQIAEEFKWKHGEKIIKVYPERLGLKKHILICGDFTEQYLNIAVFEDDLYVSEGFYHFAKQAVEFYRDDDRIAGIALYSHLWNVECNRPFLPMNDQYDVYFMQYACSWGQVWSKEKWNEFINWYKENDKEIISTPAIPENVVMWSNSWLKYHIKYCIETNKFFVYPQVAHSTNFSSKGQHSLENTNGYQVPLQVSHRNYYFPRFDESCVRYDAFFEFVNIGDYLKLDNKDVCVDLYGMKKNNLGKRYWLTLESADYKIVRSFDLSLRPHEMNVLKYVKGDIIKLYDTSIVDINEKRKRFNLLKLNIEYDIKNISFRDILTYILITAFGKVKEKLLRRGKH
ncbi:MAG: hypothetical protein WA131_02550 [Desulfitobacteriaceae bacterium]